MRVLAWLVLLLASGCSGDKYVGEVVMPDGSTGYAVQCDGTKTRCFKMAGKYCPAGYTILEDNSMSAAEGSASAVGGIAVANSEAKRKVGMVVRCGKPSEPTH